MVGILHVVPVLIHFDCLTSMCHIGPILYYDPTEILGDHSGGSVSEQVHVGLAFHFDFAYKCILVNSSWYPSVYIYNLHSAASLKKVFPT